MCVHTIELFEWNRGSQKSSFSESELRIIRKFNDTIVREKKSDALTVINGKIFTYSYVGIIQIGKKRIEILPKLFDPDVNYSITALSEKEKEQMYKTARKNLFTLLSMAGLIPFYKSGLSEYGKENDFFEFLISLFLNDLETNMGSNFHHEYVYKNDDLTHIKGKLHYRKQAEKLPSQLHTFSCIYDEFSIDNPLNRLIKATLRKISEVCKKEDNKKRAFHFCSLMHEIKDIQITASYFSKLHFNRLNEKFKEIVEFCYLILFGSTYSIEQGQYQYYALVFDMNLVFEKYVTKLLRNSLDEFAFDYQNNIYLASDHETSFHYVRNKKRLIPDIIVRKGNKSLGIIDTKYKLDLSNGYISHSDTYQMMAYCVANESDKAILLYPKLPFQSEIKEREHLIVLDKLEKEKKKDRTIKIFARSIQLFDSKGRILRRLSEEDARTVHSLLITPF